MKKIVSAILVLTAIFGALFMLASCAEEKKDIYTIANTSEATTVNTQVFFTTAEGDDLGGFYFMQTAGNDAIIEYAYKRLQRPDEVLAGAEISRIVEVGSAENPCKTYYYQGKYYDDGDAAPWVGAPSEIQFKFNLQEDKLTTPTISADGTTLIALVTPENCLEMFGFDLDANEEDITIIVTTLDQYLTKLELRCITDDGANISIVSSYSYNDLTGQLDFSAITGEEE
jgi:hypothetical protein